MQTNQSSPCFASGIITCSWGKDKEQNIKYRETRSQSTLLSWKIIILMVQLDTLIHAFQTLFSSYQRKLLQVIVNILYRSFSTSFSTTCYLGGLRLQCFSQAIYNQKWSNVESGPINTTLIERETTKFLLHTTKTCKYNKIANSMQVLG